MQVVARAYRTLQPPLKTISARQCKNNIPRFNLLMNRVSTKDYTDMFAGRAPTTPAAASLGAGLGQSRAMLEHDPSSESLSSRPRPLRARAGPQAAAAPLCGPSPAILPPCSPPPGAHAKGSLSGVLLSAGKAERPRP
jgi:hypothetical protein